MHVLWDKLSALPFVAPKSNLFLNCCSYYLVISINQSIKQSIIQSVNQPLHLHLHHSPPHPPGDRPTGGCGGRANPARIPPPPDPAMDAGSRPPPPTGAGVRVRAPLVSSAPLRFRFPLGRRSEAPVFGWDQEGGVGGQRRCLWGESFDLSARGLGVSVYGIPVAVGLSGSECLATWGRRLWFVGGSFVAFLSGTAVGIGRNGPQDREMVCLLQLCLNSSLQSVSTSIA